MNFIVRVGELYVLEEQVAMNVEKLVIVNGDRYLNYFLEIREQLELLYMGVRVACYFEIDVYSTLHSQRTTFSS